MSKVSIELEVLTNAQKVLAATKKQINKVIKSVEKQQKAEGRVTRKVREQTAARKKLSKAIVAQREDKELQ